MANTQGLTLQGGVQRVLANLTVGVARQQNYIAELALTPYDTKSLDYIIRTGSNEGLVHVGAAITKRAPGEKPETLRKRYGTTTGFLNEHMLGWNVDMTERERAAQIGPEAVNALYLDRMADDIEQIELSKEKEVATILNTAANYNGGTNSSSGAGLFSAAGIRGVVLAKKDAVANGVGVRPNRMIVGQKTHRLLLENADIKATIQYSRGGITTQELIAEFFEVDQYLVGNAVTQTLAAVGDGGTPTQIWTDDSCAIYYASPAPTYSDPSFAYLRYMTFQETSSKAFVKSWTDQSGLWDEGVYGERFKCDLSFGKAGWLFVTVT